jgi:Ras-related protein Rab-2A
MMTRKVYDCILKFIIIGSSTVGKSNILLQFTDKRFTHNSDLTIGIEFATKLVSRNKTVYKLQIWDTAGQETFRSLIRSYYRGTLGCLLVYDITRRESFESMESWLTELKNYVPNVSVVLVGNKIDLDAQREVETEEGIEFAQKHGLAFFETSAKTAQNIDQCFNYLIDQINKKIELGEINVTRGASGVRVANITEKSQGCMC